MVNNQGDTISLTHIKHGFLSCVWYQTILVRHKLKGSVLNLYYVFIKWI